MPIPDEQIFPHATGNAISTVEAHKEPQELIFYSGWVRRSTSFEVYLKPTVAVLPVCPKELDYFGRERHPLPI
jgi:glutathione S-transferase